MAGPIGTQSRWTLNSTSQGNIRLRRVEDYKISDGASTEAVNAVGEDDPVGFRDKPGAQTITFTVYQEQGKPEVDYHALKRNKEQFTLTQEIVNGGQFQYRPCRVSKIDPSGDNEGKHMFDVEIVALSKKPL